MKNKDLDAILKKVGLAAVIAAVFCAALICPVLNSRLFALRNAAGEVQPPRMKLICINLGQNTSGPEETVEKYQQALIRRDEDYAKSLLKFEAETPLTVSNPHPSGYRILSMSKENGKTYVEAEMYLQYTANPYYQIVKSTYELSKSEEGFRIDRITETNSIEVSEQDGIIYMNNGSRQTQFLKLKDIPGEYIGSSYSYRLSSLIYLESNNKLVMAIHQMNENAQSIAVTLLGYDGNMESFELIDEMKAENGTIGVSGLSADPENKYLSVDFTSSSGDGPDSSVYVYNLKDKTKISLETILEDSEIEAINSLYWFDEGLVFEVLKNGHSVSYVYNPDNGTSVQTMMSGNLAEPVSTKDNEYRDSANAERSKPSDNNDVDIN